MHVHVFYLHVGLGHYDITGVCVLNQIKSFVSHCFINVSHSVSIRHQHWLSYHLPVPEGQHTSHFLYGGNEYTVEITE